MKDRIFHKAGILIPFLGIGLWLPIVSSAEKPGMPVHQKGTERPANFKELKERAAEQGFDVHRPHIAPAEGVEIIRDLTYTKRDDRQLKLDLFLPASHSKNSPPGQTSSSPPLVVLIHGGGWRKGDKSGEHAKAIWLANRGYAAASVQYRLSGEAPFPAAPNDCRVAISFLRERAGRYGFDSDRIAVMGGSAGAHLAAFVAMTADHKSFEITPVSHAVQAAVVVAGPTDTTNPNAIRDSRNPDGNYRLFLGASFDENPGIFTTASPVHYVSPESPPCLFFGENSDKGSVAIRARLESHAIQAESFVLTGGIHGEWNWEPWFSVTMERTEDFLREVFDHQQ